MSYLEENNLLPASQHGFKDSLKIESVQVNFSTSI